MNILALFHMPQGTELIVIALIALLIFGRKLPELGRSLGKGIVEFKKGLKGMKEEMDEVNHDIEDADKKAQLESKSSQRIDPARQNERAQPTVSEKKSEALTERSEV